MAAGCYLHPTGNQRQRKGAAAMTTPDTPAAIVLRLRQEAGWSRYRLGKASNVGTSQLLRIERGEQVPGLLVARRIVAAFGVSLAVFDGCETRGKVAKE